MKINFIVLFFSVILASCSSSSSSEDIVSEMEGIQMEEEMEDAQMEEEMEEPQMEEETETQSTLMGEFVTAAHTTMGKVTVNEEHTSLSITDFKSEDGPILEMYLSTDLEATNYVSLGELKGLEGDFDYLIPNGGTLDFSEYKYVMVWCVDFSVDFGHAILE